MVIPNHQVPPLRPITLPEWDHADRHYSDRTAAAARLEKAITQLQLTADATVIASVLRELVDTAHHCPDLADKRDRFRDQLSRVQLSLNNMKAVVEGLPCFN